MPATPAAAHCASVNPSLQFQVSEKVKKQQAPVGGTVVVAVVVGGGVVAQAASHISTVMNGPEILLLVFGKY